MIRAAASFPEISTIGTPTPGWVPEPTNTTLPRPGCRLPGPTARFGGAFQDRHVTAGSGQVQRTRQPAETGTDHDDLPGGSGHSPDGGTGAAPHASRHAAA